MSAEILEKINKLGGDLGQQITDAQKASQAENKEEFKKLTDLSADTIEQLNALKAKNDAQEKVIKELEAVASRPAVGAKIETYQQYNIALAKYLKKGNAISEDDIAIGAKEFLSVVNKNATVDDISRFTKDLVEGILPDGGYFVLPDRSDQRVTRDFPTSPMRQICNVVTTSSDIYEMVIDDNQAVTGGWVGEQQSRPVTATPQIGLLAIPIHEQFASPRASQRMLDDVTFDVVSWLQNKVDMRLTRDENTAFVLGDGVKRPRGILNYNAWQPATVKGDDTKYVRDRLEQIQSGVTDGFTYDGIVNLQNALVEQYQPNAIFLMQRLTWGSVLQIKDSQNRPLFQLQDLLKTGADRVLLGKQVVFANDMPVIPDTPTANTTTPMIYGDFKIGYTIVDRIGIRVIRDNVTEKPFTLYYTTKRVGGALSNYQSLKVMLAATSG